MKDTYPLRYQASFIIEAKTPLAIGSGDKDILLDNPIVRDAFDLPYIPATSLTGVMRHALSDFLLDKKTIDCLFGYQDSQSKKGVGSRLILSSAHLLAADNKVADGLDSAQVLQTTLSDLLVFPQRDHVRMTHKGVADKENHGKFDSELLARGLRFVFEMELCGNEADRAHWEKILHVVAAPLFRIGGGTRKGFGELGVVKCHQRVLNLTNEKDLNLYLDKTTQIKLPLDASFKEYNFQTQTSNKLTHYQLKLYARDFFLFDGQYDLEDMMKAADTKGKLADMTPKIEQIIEWEGNKPKKSPYKWLIPATSVKGIIAHRVAFHYNKLKENYAHKSGKMLLEIQNFLQGNTPPKNEEEARVQKTKIEKYIKELNTNGAFSDFVGGENNAVKALFGKKAEEKDRQQIGQRGRVLFSDVYLSKAKEEKVLNHIKIDRFTSGGIDSALFSEKIAHSKEEILLDIYVEISAFEGDSDIQKAFENTLKDLANERLPLGGNSMHGHGMMHGTLTKNGQKINVLMC